MAYLLFAGDNHYSDGGAEDFKGKFDTLDAAMAAHDPLYADDGWGANVFCLDELKLVKRFEHGKWYGPDEDTDVNAEITP